MLQVEQIRINRGFEELDGLVNVRIAIEGWMLKDDFQDLRKLTNSGHVGLTVKQLRKALRRPRRWREGRGL